MGSSKLVHVANVALGGTPDAVAIHERRRCPASTARKLNSNCEAGFRSCALRARALVAGVSHVLPIQFERGV